MTHSRCLLTLIGLVVLAPSVLTSCKGPAETSSAAAAVPPTASVKALAAPFKAVTVRAAAKPKAPAKPASAPDNMSVAGSGLRFTLPDPKAPGKMLVKIGASGMSGSLNGRGVLGTLDGVSATLFQRGVAAAKLTAPTVSGDNMQQKLVATGRVTIVSLQQPGTVMRADRMTWYPNKKRVYADGNVYYHDGKYGAELSAPHMIANTFVKEIIVPSALHGNVR